MSPNQQKKILVLKIFMFYVSFGCLWMSLTVRLPISSGAPTPYYICQKDPKLHISKQFCSRVNLTATIAELRPLALIHCSSMLEQNINRFYTRILAAGYCEDVGQPTKE